MNQKSARRGLLTVAVAVASTVAATGVGAEPVDSAAKVVALERRVAALEKKRDVEPVVPVAADARRVDAKGSRSSAAVVERYLQYPGE